MHKLTKPKLIFNYQLRENGWLTESGKCRLTTTKQYNWINSVQSYLNISESKHKHFNLRLVTCLKIICINQLIVCSECVFKDEYFIDLSLLRCKYIIYWTLHEKMKVQVKSVCRETAYILQLLKYGCYVSKVAYDVALVHVYIPLW